MRTCPSCGRENADDVDFCACGEYLRWEPTNYQMPAIKPPAREPAAEQPPTAESDPPAAEQGRPARPATPREPMQPQFLSAVRPAVRKPTPPAAPPREPAQAPHTTKVFPASLPPLHSPRSSSPPPEPPPSPAGITLRLPDDEPSGGAGPLGVAVVPGNRVRVVALVRNQDSIVDNYSLVVHGLESEWYTVMPETVYLVPFGSAGAYEQEVEIHIHPPRSPQAQAQRWELSVGVVSRAHGTEVAAAPMTLGILPYEDYAIRVRPERASGRWRGKYDVAITNNANAVVLLALDAHDSDDECSFTFDRDIVELGADETRTVPLRCRPPRQIWLGRALDRRFEITCAGGEEGEKLLKAKAAARAGRGGGGLSALGGKAPKLPGVSAPKVGMPDVSLGPGGKLDVRMPNVRGPNFQGVNLRRPTLGLRALRMPDRAQAPQVSSAPLLPTQAIFRQKPWLPWWLAIVVPLLALLALALFLLLPKNVEVPNVRGAKTAFDAEKQLIAAGLVLGDTKERSSSEVKPGTVIDQSPAPGESAKKGAPVTVEVALSKTDTVVPKLVGKTLAEADTSLRRSRLTKGALSGQPPDPKLEIASTLPAAGERVKEGTPIDIFFADPKAKTGGKGKNGGVVVAPGGGSGPKDIAVPEIDPADQKGYGRALVKAGLVPGELERSISDKPRGSVVETDPAVGTKLAKGATVNMLVSAGFPQVAFDNEVNVLLANAGTGKRIPPAIAKSALQEKDPTWSADGRSVVYTLGLPGSNGGRLVSADMLTRGRAPSPLRPASEKYADPSFAPERSVLAVSRVNPTGDRDLCFGRVRGDSFTPQCIADPRVNIAFAHWSPNGRRILAGGGQPDGRFGIVQYTSKRPFSARKSDWRGGGFITRRAEGKGVRDAAISPDRKRLAAVSNLDTPGFQLYLTTPGDIELRAKPLAVPACKVMWIDSQNLAIVKLGNNCDEDAGEIVRINVKNPTEAKPVAAPGDNPAFQPLAAAG